MEFAMIMKRMNLSKGPPGRTVLIANERSPEDISNTHRDLVIRGGGYAGVAASSGEIVASGIEKSQVSTTLGEMLCFILVVIIGVGSLMMHDEFGLANLGSLKVCLLKEKVSYKKCQLNQIDLIRKNFQRPGLRHFEAA